MEKLGVKKLGLLTIMAVALFFVGFSSIPTASTKGISLAKGKIVLGGQGRVRFEYINNRDFTTANDQIDYVITRIRPYFKFLPHEQLELYFEPQFTAGWGDTVVTTATPATGTANVGTTSGTLTDPKLGLHQGFLLYKPVEWFQMKLGRQILKYGDQLVIGAVEWSNTGRSFDAAKFKFKHEKGWVDLFWSILTDPEANNASGVATGPMGDAHLFGVYSSMDLGKFFKALDFYALYRLDQTANPRPFNFVTLGARIKSKPSAIDYRFESDLQYGKIGARNQRDYQIDLEAGYTFKEAANFRIGVEGFVSSKNYNQLFPTAHKWLGFIDLFGRRNIMGFVAHFSVKPTDKWLIKLDAHTMMRYSKTLGLFRLNGTTAIGGTGASGSRLAGEEIDLTVKFQPLEFLSFQGGASLFLPMGFVKAEVGSSKPVFAYLQTNLQF